MRLRFSASVCLFATVVILSGASPGWTGTLRFFAVGDLPYLPAEADQLRDLFDRAVAEGTPFLIHVGDIKAGKAPCSDTNLFEIADIFRAQPVPVVYTPGDNEWTDCHREDAGAHDPLMRLARVREVFYGDQGVLRLERLGAERATGDDGLAYPENIAFMRDEILFVALHIVGSNNGYRPADPAAVAEFEARDAANRRFLHETVVLANARTARAMVLMFQANPLFANPLVEGDDPPYGFVGLQRALVELMDAYPGPVLAIHGDTHRFKHDRPLIDPATGESFGRFVRAEVPGSPVVGGLWIDIDPQADEPFGITPVYPVSRDRLMP